MVFVDENGASGHDTGCVDGPRATPSATWTRHLMTWIGSGGHSWTYANRAFATVYPALVTALGDAAATARTSPPVATPGLVSKPAPLHNL